MGWCMTLEDGVVHDSGGWGGVRPEEHGCAALCLGTGRVSSSAQ